MSYKIFILIIYSVTLSMFLSGCNILLQNDIKNFLMKKNKITKASEIEKNIIKHKYKIYKKEDKINLLLNKSGVNKKYFLKLIKADPSLNNLKIGQNLSWIVNKYGKLLELQWNISSIEKKIYKNVNNKFLISNLLLKKKWIHKTIFIKKNSNFFQSAFESGLNQSEINDLVKAMEWQVDFCKLKTGSNFNLVFLHNLKNNKKTLLGVKLNHSGKKYYSIRAFNGNFYDMDGFNTKEYFINYSFLKKYRISSEFNLHRMNPVTHRITRHLGVDLAMPQGTPVLATNNGKVIKACFNKIAGFYITLKNKNNYITRYMHLKKILVNIGDKIKIGQKIALSGNTGRTTGPHLHYEIWINNHAINPVNKKFLSFKKLTEKEKIIYLKNSKKILKKLS